MTHHHPPDPKTHPVALRCFAHNDMIAHMTRGPGLTEKQKTAILAFSVHLDTLGDLLVTDKDAASYDMGRALHAVDLVGGSAHSLWTSFVLANNASRGPAPPGGTPH